MIIRSTILASLVAASIATSACSRPNEPEEAPRESVEVAEAWSAGAGTQGEVQNNWLATFNDQTLIALVNEAMEHNADLGLAAARTAEARARAIKAGANLKPTVDLALGGGASGGSSGSSSNTFSGGLQFNWEIDVWDRLGSAEQAATLDAVAAEADLRAARQSIAAQVATAWFLAITTQRTVKLSTSIVESYQSTLNAVQTRADAGQAQPMDLELAKAELATNQAKLASDKGAFDDAVRSLEVLVGRYPKAELDVATALPALPPPAPAGLPSDLLERRPDIVAADRRVAAAFNSVQSAKAAKMPRFAITADGGFASGSVDPGSAIWSLGANLVGPLIDGGRLDAEVQITEAQQQAALANYVKVAQDALNEVETALAGESVIRSRLGFIESSTAEFGKAAEIAQKQFDAGVSDVLNLNQVLRQSFQSETQLLALQGEQLIQRVILHASLGGDFGEERVVEGTDGATDGTEAAGESSQP